MTDSYETNLSILHGEDDSADVRIVTRILEQMGHGGEYLNLPNGEMIIDRVLGRGEYQNYVNRKPDIIILDIGLLGMDGKEVLDFLKQHDQAKAIPVIILSGSNSMRDYKDCVRLGCNGYLQKSWAIEEFSENFRLLIRCWSRILNQNFF